MEIQMQMGAHFGKQKTVIITEYLNKYLPPPLHHRVAWRAKQASLSVYLSG